MSFGQSAGPPATARQLRELLDLLHAAGYEGFRDARGPLGFTQRQGNGKFTRDEAEALIEQLSTEADSGSAAADPPAPSVERSRPAPQPRQAARRAALAKSNHPTNGGLADIPDQVLAEELQRRGWIVVQP